MAGQTDQSWKCAKCAMPAPFIRAHGGSDELAHVTGWQKPGLTLLARAKSARAGSRSAGPGMGALV